MAVDLETARQRWLEEEPQYGRVCVLVQRMLARALQDKNVRADCTARPKELTSLLKKLIRKAYDYENVTDKAAARVVVRFRDELDIVGAAIADCFDVQSREEKADDIPYNQVGYQDVQYNVRLRPNGAETSGLTELSCEIQVRTHCQDVWSVMAHTLSYKPVIEPPPDINRRIYLLNAVLEVADRSFTEIRDAMAALPGRENMELVDVLERFFFRLVGREYDSELTRESVAYLRGLYEEQEETTLETMLEEFVVKNETRLKQMYASYMKDPDPALFLFQPEGILLLERFQNDRHVLEEHWCQRFPRSELERLCLAWGESLD